MREYRIKVTSDGMFTPQIKGRFFWHSFKEYGISGGWSQSEIVEELKAALAAVDI